MKTSEVIQTVVYVCRAVQIPISIIALGLASSLVPTFARLDSDCIDELDGISCKRIDATLGGLRYSVATGMIGIIDAVIGIVAILKPFKPEWVVVTFDSMTAGFYMGAGSTIAARLNGELCAAGPSDSHFACGRLFADMGTMFAGAVICYALVAAFWTSRARHCHSCNAELNDGHPLENPFQDPNASEQDVRPEGVLNKRRSWSQLS